MLALIHFAGTQVEGSTVCVKKTEITECKLLVKAVKPPSIKLVYPCSNKPKLAQSKPLRCQELCINQSYPMNFHPHGIAIIVVNNVNVNKMNLLETFCYLGYDVELYQNFTAVEIQNAFEQFATEHNVDLHDSLICCIFSCGSVGQILCSDGKLVQLQDIIIKLNTCLAGKPKMFFVQSCQGVDEGLVLNERDLFLTFSTTPCQNHSRGRQRSPYISELCRIFRTYASCSSLLQMHVLAASRLGPCTELKQFPEMRSQLCKDVYFFQPLHVSGIQLECIVNQFKVYMYIYIAELKYGSILIS